MTWQTQNILYGGRRNTDTPVSGNKIIYLQNLEQSEGFKPICLSWSHSNSYINSGTPSVSVMANLKRFSLFRGLYVRIMGSFRP
jgi:hypothetical protein